MNNNHVNNGSGEPEHEQEWHWEDDEHIRQPDQIYAETLLGEDNRLFYPRHYSQIPSTAFGYDNVHVSNNEEDIELQQALLASITIVPPRPAAPRPRPSLPKKSYIEIKQKVTRLISIGDKHNKEEYELILSVLAIYEEGLLEQPYVIYDPEQYQALEQLNKSFRLKTCSLMDLFVLCSS